MGRRRALEDGSGEDQLDKREEGEEKEKEEEGKEKEEEEGEEEVSEEDEESREAAEQSKLWLQCTQANSRAATATAEAMLILSQLDEQEQAPETQHAHKEEDQSQEQKAKRGRRTKTKGQSAAVSSEARRNKHSSSGSGDGGGSGSKEDDREKQLERALKLETELRSVAQLLLQRIITLRSAYPPEQHNDSAMSSPGDPGALTKTLLRVCERNFGVAVAISEALRAARECRRLNAAANASLHKPLTRVQQDSRLAGARASEAPSSAADAAGTGTGPPRRTHRFLTVPPWIPTKLFYRENPERCGLLCEHDMCLC